jgi:hypothetical protein
MADTILADNRQPITTDQGARLAAIRQRTTRGLLTFNTGKVHHLEGELWAVPSTRGGWHKVNLEDETCDCEDWTFYGSAAGVACRHVYAAAIAHARRRGGVKVIAALAAAAGDPFKAAARNRGGNLAALEERLAHENMGDEARQELRDRVIRARRSL